MTFTTGVLLGTAAIVLGFLAIRDLQRIERIRVHVEHTIRARRVTERLLSALLDHRTGQGVLDSATVAELSSWMADIATMQGQGLPDTSGVESLRYVLEGGEELSEERLLRGLALARDIAGAEIDVQQRLLDQTEMDTRSEVALAVAIIGGLITTLVLGAWVVRRRFLKPLQDLSGLFNALAERDFRAVSVDDIDPILIPLFENFNYLVTRLEILEGEHRTRALTLEGEVRKATQALLEQHRSLANAERLAVVGEMAAGVAHELRNPLAGISMSLANLRREVSEADVAERLGILISEIDRITRLLEQYLSSARHEPEPARNVDVAVLVTDLLNLLQYQVPTHIKLEGQVPEQIECVFPHDRVRQMLLNLILNSVEALGETEGRVVISASRNGGRVIMSVGDDGPGFPEEMLQGRMRAFATHRKAGTGLGLIMVRRVVEELGGRLELANREPHGACVTLNIPLSNG
jgi:signal transduction histidine kinase